MIGKWQDHTMKRRLLIFIISITAGWQYQTKKKSEEIVNIDNVEYWRGAWLHCRMILNKEEEKGDC